MNHRNGLIVAGLATWLVIGHVDVNSVYSDEVEQREERAAIQEKLEGLERFERELREAFEAARRDENEDRIRGLSREREQLQRHREELLHRKEQLEREWEERERRERAHEEDRERREHEAEREHQERELHRERQHLELRAFEIEVQNLELTLEKNRLELELLRHEAAAHMVKFADNPRAMAAVAAQRIVETAEHPEHAAEVLMGLMDRTRDQTTRRIIQMHLAHLWMESERPERAREALRQLIVGPPNRREAREAEHGRERAPEEPRNALPRRDQDPERPREAEVMQRARKIFAAYDKNHDDQVGFEEWVSMKEGEMTPDLLEREQQRFGEIAGDDGLISPREFLRWQQRRDRPEQGEPRGRERDEDWREGDRREEDRREEDRREEDRREEDRPDERRNPER